VARTARDAARRACRERDHARLEVELKLAIFSLLLAIGACSSQEPTQRAAPSASARAAARAQGAPAAPRLASLLSAEQRRDSKAVTDDDLSHRDVAVRRAAARALARISDRRAREPLSRLLADEDPEVVAFAAYGLGYGCREGEPELVRALTARAASLIARPAPLGDARLTPLPAIADALGRCGSSDAERTLRAWLGLDREVAEAAAVALGRIGSKKGRLDDASLVALLDAAARPNGLDQALFAFTRLSGLGASVRSRLLEVAKKELESSGVKATLALRALPAAGEEAAPLLGQALADARTPSASRAEAARGLARLGEPGQAALRSALAALPSSPALKGADHAVLSALLGAVSPPLENSTEILTRLALLELPEDPVQRRHAIAIRCRASALLADKATASKNLVACDPNPEGREGALAMIGVLDRGKLEGARFRRYEKLVASDDPVVRERALRLLGGHPEAPRSAELLARALDRRTPGDTAAAAETLAKYPERGGAPERPLMEALTRAFDEKGEAQGIEARAALLDAAAALQLLGFKGRLEAECKSPWPALRQHAENGLRVLGERERTCNDFTPPTEPPAELARLVEGRVTLELDSDAGQLRLDLDPSFAPVAVTRFVELARQGFYDGTSFHRVVPGFVVQFGDPTGTGYGGAPRPPLRCETSPQPFQKFSVGVALAGRDTGNSQLFVTLGRFPHLDGEYTLVGEAEGAWDSAAEGDVIRKVRVNASR
jgi:cyclophilin family peptidyl-prolyl cis-trans isomerase